MITVSDGTGTINVSYKKSRYDIDRQKLQVINNKHKKRVEEAIKNETWLKTAPQTWETGFLHLHERKSPIIYPSHMPGKYRAVNN